MNKYNFDIQFFKVFGDWHNTFPEREGYPKYSKPLIKTRFTNGIFYVDKVLTHNNILLQIENHLLIEKYIAINYYDFYKDSVDEYKGFKEFALEIIMMVKKIQEIDNKDVKEWFDKLKEYGVEYENGTKIALIIMPIKDNIEYIDLGFECYKILENEFTIKQRLCVPLVRNWAFDPRIKESKEKNEISIGSLRDLIIFEKRGDKI